MDCPLLHPGATRRDKMFIGCSSHYSLTSVYLWKQRWIVGIILTVSIMYIMACAVRVYACKPSRWVCMVLHCRLLFSRPKLFRVP